MVRKMFIFLHPGADRNNGGSSFQTRERSHASSGPRSGAYSTVHSRSSGEPHMEDLTRKAHFKTKLEKAGAKCKVMVREDREAHCK